MTASYFRARSLIKLCCQLNPNGGEKRSKDTYKGTHPTSHSTSHKTMALVMASRKQPSLAQACFSFTIGQTPSSRPKKCCQKWRAQLCSACGGGEILSIWTAIHHLPFLIKLSNIRSGLSTVHWSAWPCFTYSKGIYSWNSWTIQSMVQKCIHEFPSLEVSTRPFIKLSLTTSFCSALKAFQEASPANQVFLYTHARNGQFRVPAWRRCWWMLP